MGLLLNSLRPITKRLQSLAAKFADGSSREFAVDEQGISRGLGLLTFAILRVPDGAAAAIWSELNHPIKVSIYSLMAYYKRNQVEEAIVRTLRAEDARVSELKLKMKRLLVTDRRLGRGKRSDDKAGHRYAFYSQRPQGSGVEVMFNSYEAFALLAALLVLEHGIPQAKVVSILQKIRSDFEAAHRDTLQKDPKALFDPQSVQAMARSAMFAERQHGTGVFSLCEVRYR